MNDLISPNKDKVMYDYLVSSGAMAASAVNVQQSLILEQDSWFELRGFGMTSSLDTDTNTMPNNSSVQISDLSTGRLLSNLAIPQRLFSAYNPFYRLARPCAFPPNANLLFTFQNLIASTNTTTVDLRGYRYFNGPGTLLTNQQAIPFSYLVTATLSGNASQLVTITLQQDSWFEWHLLTGTSSADVAATDIQPNNFSVRIQDAKGPYYSNSRVPQNILTPYNNQYLADRPIQLDPSTNLSFDILDLSGGTNTVTLVIHGFKLFP